MSVSDNYTLSGLSRDNGGSYQLLDGHAYGLGDLAVNSYAKSPYTDPDLCSVEVGLQKTQFLVHRMVLAQSPELEMKPFSKLWGEKSNESIALPDLDEPTAHTLVHYLYSGRYQALRAHESTSRGAAVGYKLGTCVYCAAIRYKLPGLAELAKEKITSFGEELSILDILGVAREHAFPNLPEEEAWFPAYLEDAIKGAVSEDPELPVKPQFVDQIQGDRKFRLVVMQAIVNSYSMRPTVLRERQTGLSTPMTESKLEGGTEIGEPQPETSEQELEVLKEEVKEDPVVETTVEAPVAKAEVVAEEAPKFEDTEPAPQVPAELEPFTDELGFGTSKIYRGLDKKIDQAADNEAVSEPKPTMFLNKRDSVIEPVELVACETPSSIEDKTILTTESAVDPAPVAADGGVSGTTTTPKKKKKKGKKSPGNNTATTAA